MEIRYYRYFVALAEELHFGKAAERLHIAQPALSIQIKALENALGGRLFERTKRSVRLTEAGKVFLEQARKILLQEELAISMTKRAIRGELGCLRIGYSGNAAYSGVLGKSLQKFRARHPAVDVQLIEMNPVLQVREIEKHSIHMGFLTTLSIDIPESIETSVLASWPVVLALPCGHRLAGKKLIPMDAVREEPFIVWANEEEFGSASAIRTIAGFDPLVSYQAANAMLMVALVGAGMGVAMVPASLKAESMRSKVVYRPLTGMKAKMDCTLAYRCVEQEPAVKLFAQSLVTGQKRKAMPVANSKSTKR